MEWKLTGSEPVYLQIMESFRGAVLSGEFGPGDKIPSVRDLAAQARVNPNTMQRAMSELEQERLLCSHGTLGRFVTDDPAILEALRQQQAVYQQTLSARVRELESPSIGTSQSMSTNQSREAKLVKLPKWMRFGL